MKRVARYSIFFILLGLIALGAYYSSVSSVVLLNPLQQTIKGREIALDFSGTIHPSRFEERVRFLPEVEGAWSSKDNKTWIFEIASQPLPAELLLQFEGSWRDTWRRSMLTPEPRRIWINEVPPLITKVTPSPGSILKGQMPISFYWDKSIPFLAGTSDEEFSKFVSIEPAVVGEWKALGDKAVLFIPEEAWLGSNTYEITFDKTIMGNELSVSYETERINIISANFEAIHGRQPIDLRFNQPFVMEDMWWIKLDPPMDFEMEYGFKDLPQEELDQALVVGRDPNVLRLKPRRQWKKNTAYSLEVPSLVRSLLGPLPPHQGFSYRFETLKPFEVSHLQKPLSADQPFEIVFNHPVSSVDFWKYLDIDDGTQDSVQIMADQEVAYESTRFWIEPSGDGWDPSRLYKIFLDKRLTDIYDQTLGQDQLWEYAPVVKTFLRWSDQDLVAQDVYSPGDVPALSVDYGGKLKQLSVEIERNYLFPQKVRKFYTLHGDEKLKAETKWLDLARDFSELMTSDKKLKPGEYKLLVKGSDLDDKTNNDITLETTFYVSDFAVLYDDFGAHAWIDVFTDENDVLDFKSVDLQLVQPNGNVTLQESVGLPYKVSPGYKKIFVVNGDRAGVLIPKSYTLSQPSYRVNWITDKSYYKSGETLQIQGWLYNLNLKEKDKPLGPHTKPLPYRFDLWRNDQYVNTISKGMIENVSWSNTAALNDIAKGNYELRLYVGEDYTQLLGIQSLRVDLPDETMVVTPHEEDVFMLESSPVQYAPESKMTLKGSIKNQEGRGLKKKNIIVEIFDGEGLMDLERIQTSRKGFFNFPFIVPQEPGRYKAVFKTSSSEGLKVRDTFDFIVAGDEGLRWDSENWALVNYKENYLVGDTAEIFVGHPDSVNITQLKGFITRGDRIMPLNFDQNAYKTWIKVEPWMMPNIFVSLWVEAEKDGQTIVRHLKTPLVVGKASEMLEVDMNLEQASYTPGEVARIDIQTKYEEVPVSAEVRFYVQYSDTPFESSNIDFFEALYEPLPDLSVHQDTYRSYEENQTHSVMTSHKSLSKLGTTHLVRTFSTDQVGKGSLEFLIPPKSPYWRVVALAQSQDRFGSDYIELEVPSPLDISVEKPDFIRVGDLTHVAFDLSRSNAREILKLDLVLHGPDGIKIDYPRQSVRIWDNKRVIFGLNASRDFWYDFFRHQDGAHPLVFQLSLTSATGLRAGEVVNIPLYPPLKTTGLVDQVVEDQLNIPFPKKTPWKEQVEFSLTPRTSAASTPFLISAWKPEGYTPTLYQSGDLGRGKVVGSFVPQRSDSIKGLQLESSQAPYRAQVKWHQFFLSENMDPVFDDLWIEREYFHVEDETMNTPVTDFALGKSYKARVRFSVNQSQKGIKVSDFVTSGVDLETIEVKPSSDYCPSWCGFDYVGDPLKLGHLNFDIKDLPLGTYEFTYTFKALIPGDYEGFPPTIVDLDGGALKAHGAGSRILIRE